MEFALDPEQRLIIDTVRRFVEEELARAGLGPEPDGVPPWNQDVAGSRRLFVRATNENLGAWAGCRGVT
jgi:alkylation response protein AidB-like acyl-CoA dehydrogenase